MTTEENMKYLWSAHYDNMMRAVERYPPYGLRAYGLRRNGTVGRDEEGNRVIGSVEDLKETARLEERDCER